MCIKKIDQKFILANVQGLPVIQAKGEAEALCAALQIEGLVDLCMSNDADIVVFGATQALYKVSFECVTSS